MPELQALLLIRQLNLFDNWPIKPGVNVIFCRNVLIYFGADAQKELLHRFANILAVGGFLFLGHSESLASATNRFKRVSTTVYEKIC